MNDDDSRLERAVPVIEEELVTGTRKVKTGSVRVRKKVQRLHRTVDIPTVRDVVDVTRKAMNQVVTSAPKVREEGDTLIIPVVEEEIVVQKRLILREEIYVTRRRTESTFTRDVTLGREVATVERLDADGRMVETPAIEELKPARAEVGPLIPETGPVRKRKGLLD